MFTGIVQGIATVVDVARHTDLVRMKVQFPSGSLDGIELGASVSLSGCCLTVTKIEGDLLGFDLVTETLNRTTLGIAVSGTRVNFERSMRMGQEIGGHLLSGHIDTIARIIRIASTPLTKEITFRVDAPWAKFLFSKGYIALNGASLTIVSVDRLQGIFSVALIPETLQRTTFGELKEADGVNVEVDKSTQVIVETVERILSEREKGA